MFAETIGQQQRRAKVEALLAQKGPLDLKSVEVSSYDARHRDPQFAAADITSVWELVRFSTPPFLP